MKSGEIKKREAYHPPSGRKYLNATYSSLETPLVFGPNPHLRYSFPDTQLAFHFKY